MQVLMAYKTADIDAAVKALDQSKQDVLMKYIYRGFELSSDSNSYGAQLLVWHDKASLTCSSSSCNYTPLSVGVPFILRANQNGEIKGCEY